jgi:RsiW-degrading membrane proteinase PrsW (M82 family)
MTHCENCGASVPEGDFCVRCGAPLAASAGHRRGFAAAPRQRLSTPDPFATLLPQLPRADMSGYRVAALVGTAVVIALGLAGLYPVALIAAAALVPLLTAVYFHDADIYEDQPWFVIAFTFVWGALFGVGLALLATAVSPSPVSLAQTELPSPLLTVVLLPVLGILLAILGPALVLLPYRRFNDVLDGAAFGAVSAAALAGAQVFVYGFQILDNGLRPAGATAPWVARLASIGVLLPILTMAVAGAATASLWWRFRGPDRRGRRIDLLFSPWFAMPAAAVLIVAAAAGQRWLPVGWWLVGLALLDVVALLWLRLLIREGLLQESAEREIGPSVRCSNCGSETPRHTFCRSCGVALGALPKTPEESRASGDPPGESQFSRRRRVTWLAGTFAAICVIAAAAVALLAPPSATRPCPPSPAQCGEPIRPARPFLNQVHWRSPSLGFGLTYAANQWDVKSEGSEEIDLDGKLGEIQLSVSGERAEGRSADDLVAARVSQVGEQVLGLQPDPDPENVIFSPGVGQHPGAGGPYVGAVDTPQGVGGQVFVVVMAATHAGIGVTVTMVTDDADPDSRLQLYQLADVVINSVVWPRR